MLTHYATIIHNIYKKNYVINIFVMIYIYIYIYIYFLKQRAVAHHEHLGDTIKASAIPSQ